MHDERYFSNPHSFIPERWLENEKGSERCVREAWIPFLIGRRNCIGKPYPLATERADNSLALLELRLVLTRLIWQFDMELKEKDQAVPLFNFASISAGPLEIRMSNIRSN